MKIVKLTKVRGVIMRIDKFEYCFYFYNLILSEINNDIILFTTIFTDSNDLHATKLF